MGALETREFIDKVKIKLSKEYVTELVDSYLTSLKPANSLNAFDNLVSDDNLKGFPDRKELSSILSNLLTEHVQAGGSANSFSGMMMNDPHRISFNATDISLSGDKVERANKFSISVNGTNLFAVLKQILSKAKEQGYNYDIDIPIMRDQDQGIIDAINIYCSSKDLFKTVEFINSFGDEITSLLGVNTSKGMHLTDSIGYDTFDAESGKWSRDIVGETLVASIDNVISTAVEQSSIQVTVEDANYYNSEHDMTASYLYMKDLFTKSNVDFYGLVMEKMKSSFEGLGIRSSNIFMPDSVIRSIYVATNAVPQVTSPSGFVTASVIKAKPAEITFEGQNQTIAPAEMPPVGVPAPEVLPGSAPIPVPPAEASDILGANDIPDLPAGFQPMGAPVDSSFIQAPQAPVQGEVPPVAAPAPMPAAPVAQANALVKGPEMMLVPEMLERHHNDQDIEGLYQAFVKVKNDESQISSKIMQLNQFWPDLTYADFIAFKQYDQAGDFITDNFIQLWVTTKQEGLTPSVSSEEVYNNLSVPAAQAPVVDTNTVPQGEVAPQAPAATGLEQAPVPGALPASGTVNPYSSKTARVIDLISRGPQAPAPEPAPAPMPAPMPGVDPNLNSGVIAPQDQLVVQGTGNTPQVTGMYNDAPVQVQPLDGASLTPAETQAMMNVGNNQQLMDLNKYSFFPNTQETLSQPVRDVDGTVLTLYDYLEKYNVLGIIPLTATFTTADGTFGAQDFIVNSLARYVVTNGAIAVDDYMELFNITMNNKEQKKGLFGKILGGIK